MQSAEPPEYRSEAHGRIKPCSVSEIGLVAIAGVLAEPDPVQALREASPQARRHFALTDQYGWPNIRIQGHLEDKT